jgi:hypothetical protein
MKMVSKTGTTRLYEAKGRTVFVASGDTCPRVNLVGQGTGLKVRDDYSKGFKAKRSVFKAIFG